MTTMTREKVLARNGKIATAGKATRARRADMRPVTVTLKIAENKLKPAQQEALARVFLEAKWFKNAALASGELEKFDYRAKSVVVKTPQGKEERELRFLGSHLKQALLQEFSDSKKSLSALKKKGHRVGALKFTREVNSLHLKQHGVTYQMQQEQQRVRVQGIPGTLRYHGGKQMQGKEIASAKLVRKPSGYYLKVSCYEDVTPLVTPLPPVGGDFGVDTHVTLSDGREFNAVVGETERLKRYQRKLVRQEKGSNNYRRTLAVIHREYEKMDNRKNDAANQLVSQLKAHELVVFQDDPLPAWKVRYGKQLQHSILGRVKERIRRMPQGGEVPRWCPTTQYCPRCEYLTKLPLSQRMYLCSHCGYERPRDVHGAENALRFYQSQSPVERGVAPVEGMVRLGGGSPAEHAPVKQETTSPKETLPAVSAATPPKRRGLQPRP